MTRLLHFTLGPVQGFIADARRTRDLWAGSFLLSWLSGKAMAALTEKGGKIIFPEVAGNDLFEAIRLGGHAGGNPCVGSLPNRFKADVTGVVGDPVEICETAIRESWKRLEKAVWEQFLGPRAGFDDVANEATKAIWDRQVGTFWEINWVAGEAEQGKDGRPLDDAWLDQRKNWRSHFPIEAGKPSVEGGDLCRLMGRYQEISGFPRIGGKGKQDAFYAALRAREYIFPSKRQLGELNIGETERLCAIALIKRLFPLLDDIENVIGWRPGGKAVTIVNWPSVSYIAAVPWLKGLMKQQGDNGWTAAYATAVGNAIIQSHKGETETKLFGLPDEGFFELDGHLLHEDGIRAWEDEGLNGNTETETQASRKALLNAYGALCGSLEVALKAKNLSDIKTRPTEFYAVLIMDGDRIGAKIRDYEDVVKRGLAGFTKAVKSYFDPLPPYKNPADGVLIYAGGDDVLALLPLDTAIKAALHLRQAYRSAFEDAIDEKNPAGADLAEFALSGAIVFAQYKIPLRAVLDQAHKQLDKIAKEKNGRDSLAIAVLKPGGIAFSWVSCWASDPVATMEMIAKDRSDYSTSFFYNIRERYAPLFAGDEPDDQHDFEAAFGEAGFMQSILVAEYKKQPGNSKLTAEEAISRVTPLMTIGKPLEGGTGQPAKDGRYHFDSALVARFLSEEGRWALTAEKAPEKGGLDG